MGNPINRQKPTIIEKVWGYEEIINNDDSYCCKFLHLNNSFRCSLHYHKIKKETFRVLRGEIILQLIHKKYHMRKGDFITVHPGTTHAFFGLTDAVILEVSTKDYPIDSYRIHSLLSGPFNKEELLNEMKKES